MTLSIDPDLFMVLLAVAASSLVFWLGYRARSARPFPAVTSSEPELVPTPPLALDEAEPMPVAWTKDMPRVVPEFTVSQDRRFREILFACLHDEGCRGRWESRDVLTIFFAGNVRQDIGLVNLAQLCRQSPGDDWVDVIGHHVKTIAKLGGAEPLHPRDFAEARPMLRLRLQPPDLVAAGEWDNLVWREDFPGTRTTLVIDGAKSTSSVQPSELEAWGISAEAAFAAALANARGSMPPERSEVDLEATLIHVLEDPRGDIYTANEIFLLDRWPEFAGSAGTLVAIPRRDVVMALPLEPGIDLAVVNRFALLAARICASGPYSIAPHLYWFDAGKMRCVGVRLEQNELHLGVPKEFGELLSDE